MFPKSPRIVDKEFYRRYGQEHEYCEVCGRRGWIGPHHIIFRSAGGGDTEGNLITLCQEHHENAHGPDAKEWRDKFVKMKVSHNVH